VQTQLLSIVQRRRTDSMQPFALVSWRCVHKRICTRIYVECAFTRPCTCIWLEIRKEAWHEQWLAALRNNVVFVGSFYLPMAQECSLQSASKFIPVLYNAIGPSECFVLARFYHEDFKDIQIIECYDFKKTKRYRYLKCTKFIKR